MTSFNRSLSILTALLVLAASFATTTAPSDARSLKRKPIIIEIGGAGAGGPPPNLGRDGLTRDKGQGKPVVVEVGGPTGTAVAPVVKPIKTGDHANGRSAHKLAKLIKYCQKLLGRNNKTHSEPLPQKCVYLLPQL